jgi:hypothetical protein
MKMLSHMLSSLYFRAGSSFISLVSCMAFPTLPGEFGTQAGHFSFGGGGPLLGHFGKFVGRQDELSLWRVEPQPQPFPLIFHGLSITVG